MQFCDHVTHYSEEKNIFPKKWKGPHEFYTQRLSDIHDKLKRVSSLNGRLLLGDQLWSLAIENAWHEEVRPYFKVWPSIVNQLIKLNLDVPRNQMQLSNRIVCVRFPVDGGLIVDGRIIHSFIVACTINNKKFPWNTLSFSINESEGEDRFIHIISPMDLRIDETWSEYIDSLENGGRCYGLDLNSKEASKIDRGNQKKLVSQVLRVGLTVLLLANDPTIIQSDVLADDRRRFDESTDPADRQRLIDKARKRGIVGWRLGEEYETIPHIRRPHFALFHTGKGRSVPRILPVKGCVVHREKLTSVPTGYILPDGREIEPATQFQTKG